MELDCCKELGDFLRSPDSPVADVWSLIQLPIKEITDLALIRTQQ